MIVFHSFRLLCVRSVDVMTYSHLLFFSSIILLTSLVPSVMVVGTLESRSTDTIGRQMAYSINGSDYGILNWDSPTRVPPNAEPSSPYVSISIMIPHHIIFMAGTVNA